ncbi:MAG: hypothetical protein WBQ60_10890 [Asticcacaulis sp.]
MGDQIFTIDHANFSALWGWVPIIDFAVTMAEIAHKLKAGSSEESFLFTESEAELKFVRIEATLTISATYVTAKAGLLMDEFVIATEFYKTKVLEEAASIHPDLMQNAVFINLMEPVKF